MELIIKKSINLINKDTIIKITYQVETDNHKNEIINFDIDDEKEKINHIIDIFLGEKITYGSPIYILLSEKLFKEIPSIKSISYETSDIDTILTREDFNK